MSEFPGEWTGLANLRRFRIRQTTRGGGTKISILIIGRTGFISRRLIPLLANCGEEIACMDINPQTANFSTASRSASCEAMSASSTMS
jgi:hypothetical protein